MLTKKSKVISNRQANVILAYLATTKHPIRNRLIFLLSVKAGLRAKEISELRWSMVTDAEGWIDDEIRLPDSASKGQSGGVIPIARSLREALSDWARKVGTIEPDRCIIHTQRCNRTSPQVVVNMFWHWYRAVGFDGCSSHSGRRTFITNAARNIGQFGGSLRDVQALARHRSLSMTQSYIEVDSEAIRKVVDA